MTDKVMKQIENKTLRTLAEYGIITGSIWIMVIGIYFFKFPNNFAFGGVTGFATVVSAVSYTHLLGCAAEP